MTAEPTVFIVDDDEALRESLTWLLESVRLPSRTFASAQEFLRAFDRNSPGCLVLDVRMPGMSGLELLDRLMGEGIGMPIILLTAHADVPMAVRALKGGAVDFLTKPFSSQELLDRIQEALENDRCRREQEVRVAALAARFALLTPREREVMNLVVEGNSNKEIAAALGVSCKTVEAHRTKVMDKTKAGSVAGLVRMALACGAADSRHFLERADAEQVVPTPES